MQLPQPSYVQFELTSRCNLKCQMCPLTDGATVSSAYPAAMSEPVWNQVMEAGRMTGNAIIAGYGEPLLDRDWFQRLSALDAAGINFGLTTNATLVTAAKAASLASLSRLFHINVSIDSPDPAIYRAIRGGDLSVALRGLGHLAAALPEPGRLTVSSILMGGNAASLMRMPALLAEIGVRVYILQGLVELNTRVDNEHLYLHDTMADKVDAIHRACASAGIELRLTIPERLDLELKERQLAGERYHAHSPTDRRWTKRCMVPWEIPFVDKDGRVFPCCYASTSPATVVGDLKRQPFVDVWQGEPLRRFRSDLLDGATTPAVCRGCSAASWGEHPLVLYAAQLLLDQSDLTNPNALRLRVRNVGRAVWKKSLPLRIGTAEPHDRHSPGYHPSWLSRARPGAFLEETVEPGQVATFRFKMARPSPWSDWLEPFQLVIDGVCWLPDTGFTIHLRARRIQRAIGRAGSCTTWNCGRWRR